MKFNFFIAFFLFFSSLTFSSTNLVTVTGFVTDKEFRLGNAEVSFYNSENKVKTTQTDLSGNFNIQLPKNKYRISIKKNGYTSLLGDNYFVDYIFNEPKPLILNMTNNKIYINGKVFSESGLPIFKANVKVKIDDKIKTLLTDKNGNFSFEGETGIISILAEKIGYYGNGTALFIQNDKFVNDIVISLQEKTFYISGIIAENSDFLNNVEIELVNGLNNKVIAKVTTSNNGFFEFRNIPFHEKAFFRISKPKFRSNYFPINKNLRQFNIFINN